MRTVHEPQMSFGEIDISKIKLNPKCRDDIPAILSGLQFIYVTPELHDSVFNILKTVIPKRTNDDSSTEEVSSSLGRPGMAQWKILVFGVLRLGLNTDYDRIHDLANNHNTIRQMLGHSDWDDTHEYSLQTIKDNLKLFTPEVLDQINQEVIKAGHSLVKKKQKNGLTVKNNDSACRDETPAPEKLRGRCDSFVLETNVHFPTDISLLFDAVRKSTIESARLAELYGLTDGTAKVSVSQPSSLVIADVQVTPGSVDEISAKPISLPAPEVDGFGVEFISAVESSSASRLLDLTLDRENTEFARLVRTSGLEIELESAVQLLFSDDLNKVGFINKGTRKNYNLYLEQIGLNPGKYTHSISIEIEDSSADWLTPYSWDDLDRTYVQLERDIGNDGTIDYTEILTELQATIDIDPDVMNLKSNGEWITAYIELPAGYNVNDIDVSTINLITPPGDLVEDAIPVDPGSPVTIGDHDNNDIPDMMVKFDRNAVASNLDTEDTVDDGTKLRCEIELTIMGKFFDDTYFSGTDMVGVIDKKK